MKTCKQCNIEKDLNNFYVHKEMLDGYLNKCKECVKERIAKHRELNIDYINDYDKKRAMLPHRVKARKEYLKTENGKEAKTKAKPCSWFHKVVRDEGPSYGVAKSILVCLGF